jgi:hypothetical protein
MKVIKYGMTEVEYACQKDKSNCFKKEVGVNYPRLLREHDWKYNWVHEGIGLEGSK